MWSNFHKLLKYRKIEKKRGQLAVKKCYNLEKNWEIKMDLNTLTKLLNIPGDKVVEIISITADEIHYCGFLNPRLNT